MKNKLAAAVFAVVLATISTAAFAQNAMVNGEVKKIDETAAKEKVCVKVQSAESREAVDSIQL